MTLKHQSTSAENDDISPWKIHVKPHRGCDDVDMFVPTSDSGVKKHCCAYCHKRYTKLVRHLQMVHKSEAAVKKFGGLPIGNVYFLILVLITKTHQQ